MVLEKFCCCKLETGGLILGVFGTVSSLIFFLGGLFELNNDVTHTRNHYFLSDYLQDAPEHIVRIVYVAISVLDVLCSVLLVVGILKRSRWLLVPWIVDSMLMLVMTCAEIFLYLVPAFLVTGTIGGFLYLWYCIVSLYVKFDNEEKSANGVPMTSIENGQNTNLPYSNFNNDK